MQQTESCRHQIHRRGRLPGAPASELPPNGRDSAGSVVVFFGVARSADVLAVACRVSVLACTNTNTLVCMLLCTKKCSRIVRWRTYAGMRQRMQAVKPTNERHARK